MKQLPLFCVVALLGAAVSAPAQVSIEARLGRLVRGSVAVGHREVHSGHSHREPERRVSAAPRGHWETRCEQVLVPGYWSEEHVPPTYGWITDACGHTRWGVVDRGGCRRIWVPARWETRSRQVWVAC